MDADLLKAVVAASLVLSDADALALISQIAATRPNIGRGGYDVFEFTIPADANDLDPGPDADPWVWHVSVNLVES